VLPGCLLVPRSGVRRDWTRRAGWRTLRASPSPPPRCLTPLPPFSSSSSLCAEGALTCQKDVKLEKHHILALPNLHVVMAMKSLKSMGHVREVFNWQWHYFFLTDEGVTYLRNFLHLPEDVIPATLKKAAIKPLGVREDGDRPRRFGDRAAGDKSGAPAGEFRPRFGAREGGAPGGAPRDGGYRRAAPAGTA
jgi:small subunit ribosomal protein S10e